MALKFSAADWAGYTSVKVGLEPSVSSGLVDLLNDPDKNGVFKVTDKNAQVFKVVAQNGTNESVMTYDLSELTCETE